MKSGRKKRADLKPRHPKGTGPYPREATDDRSASGRPLLLIELFTNDQIESLMGLGGTLEEFCLSFIRKLGIPYKIVQHNMSENPAPAVSRDVSVLPSLDITDRGKTRRFYGNLDTFKSVIQSYVLSALGHAMSVEAEAMKRAARKMIE